MSKRLIYAEDAIDAICKACSIVGDYHKCDGYPETSTWCDELVALRALPSAQPEIIRCKDCKHYNAGFECLIEGYGLERNKDWYCADAERRTE